MSLNSTAISRPAQSRQVAVVHARNERQAAGLTGWGGLLLIAAAAAAVTGSRSVVPAGGVPVSAGVSALVAPAVQKAAAAVQAQTPAAADAAEAHPAQASAEPSPEPSLPAIAFAAPAAPVLAFKGPDHKYYEQLRARLRWLDVRMGDNKLRTPDPVSRILLAQSAAQKAALHEVGLNFADVYGIINAETSWIPRTGASKDGTPNLGIAQFEPATAKALGLRNPHDPVEAIHVAAIHLKDAAEWSAKRISGLKLSEAQRAMKLREGVSIYYNLSTKGRNKWNGLNTAALPIETQRHISNARRGAREAAELASQLASVRARTQMPGVMTASNSRGGS